MSSNSLGKAFRVTCFGESHGPAIGVVIDGCPSGMDIDDEKNKADLPLIAGFISFTKSAL